MTKKCKRCGSEDTYHYDARAPKDHISVNCNSCGFQWLEDTWTDPVYTCRECGQQSCRKKEIRIGAPGASGDVIVPAILNKCVNCDEEWVSYENRS